MSWKDLTEGVLDACHEVFAEDGPVEYWPRSGGPMVPITGIFRDASTTLDAGDGASIATTVPTMGIKLSALPGPLSDGDEFKLPPPDGRRFRVTAPGLDGEGGADCVLEEIEP